MAADDEEATLNENAGSDAGAFAPVLLVGDNIRDEKGEASKKNLLTAVAAPSETINSGVVAADGPKEKS